MKSAQRLATIVESWRVILITTSFKIVEYAINLYAKIEEQYALVNFIVQAMELDEEIVRLVAISVDIRIFEE